VNDAEVIATIVAGDLDGLAAALNRYAAPLYEHCYPMAPEDAAEAVEDAFIIAWSKVDGLRNPDKLFAWLQAVADNECLRRRLAKGHTGPPGYVPIGAYLPPEIPGRVLSACADNTPPGRARRVSVTHQAGPFGFDGFPKTRIPAEFRRRIRRRPLATASLVGVAAAVTAAAVTGAIGFPIGQSNHVQAAGVPVSVPVHGNVSHVSAGLGAALPTTPARQIPPGTGAPKPSYQPRHAASGQPGSVAAAASGTMAVPPPPRPVVSPAGGGPGHNGKGAGLGLLKQHGNGNGNDQGDNSGGNG
jgi:hypothetical protein